LAFWQEGREQRASVREKLLSEAIELRSGLIGQARSSVGDAVPALPPEVVARDRARLAVANLGGCLGIPLGFFGGFIVFVTFMVSVEPKFEAFWLMALLFFGSLGGGAILGGVLGRWIAAGIARLLPAGRVATALGTSLSPEAALRRARAKPGASSTSQPPLFLGVIFALVGTVFAGVGIGMGVWWTVWAVGARRTEGTVVSMVASGDEGGMAPVVSYQVAGKTYEHRSKFSSSPPAYSVGNKVSILYRPENPSEAGIDSLFDRWLFPVCFGGVGSLFAAIGWGIIIRSRRRSPGHGD